MKAKQQRARKKKKNVVPKIITNRQLNFTLCPVDKNNSKKMPHKTANFEIDGVWNHHNSIILDALIDYTARAHWQKMGINIPKSWRNQQVQGFLQYSFPWITAGNIEFLSEPLHLQFLQGLGIDFEQYAEKHNLLYATKKTIYANIEQEFHYEQLRKRKELLLQKFQLDRPERVNLGRLLVKYPILSKYKYTIKKRLKEISSVKFKMNYKTRFTVHGYNVNGHHSPQSIQTDVYYKMQDFERIIDIEFIDNDIKIHFNTPLGELVLFNTLKVDTDWHPFSVKDLSKNAYFIYKRFILNEIAGDHKAENEDIDFYEIKEFLNITWSNNSAVRKKIINKAFDELKEKGFLHSYTYTDHYGYKNYHLKFC